MKKYTQEEFDKFPIENRNGMRICPSGDYRLINKFAEWCSFAGRCLFAEWCSFEKLKFKKGETVFFIRINNIGSRKDGCQIFNAIEGLYVRCGCWFGKVEDFLAEVKKNHAGTIHEKTYGLAIELAKAQFRKDE
jgi:hypothetical protein